MVEDERPAQAAALEDPEGFDALSDDLVLRACLRAPFVTHGTLAAVCARFKSLLRSDAFGKLRLEYGVAECGVVVAGGSLGGDVSAECKLLSLADGRWRPIPPMSGPRRGACSVIIDNEVWVMGGEDEYWNEKATVEIYSPKTNSWRSSRPMKQRRRDAVAGVVGGLLVVAGGYCGHTELTAVEAYTGTGWISLPPLPHAVWAATGCVLNGRLHVIGGRDSNKLQVLEMTEKHGPCYMEHGWSWSCKAELPTFRHGAASVVYEGRIWVMGGEVFAHYYGEHVGRIRPTASVITYDDETDNWGTAPHLPFPCHACRDAATEGGNIFVYVGQHLPYEGGFWRFRDAMWSAVAGDAGLRGFDSPVLGSVLLG